jgi:ankyrin repeat protein
LQQCSHTSLGQELLQVQDARGHTPLHYSMLFEHNDVAAVLVKRGAPKGCTDARGQTPLDVAISRGRIDETLLEMLSLF